MQQSYRALRVIAEAQTIRLVLHTNPGELMLNELCAACAALNAEGSAGIKAVILDFAHKADGEVIAASAKNLALAAAAVRGIAQPVLAVIRASLSGAACTLLQATDLTLAVHSAALLLPGHDALTGEQAARLGAITWSTPAAEIDRETERILDMLRTKSAVALTHAKASVRLAVGIPSTAHSYTTAERLEALQKVNALYLTQVMQSQDAHEGLHAFLEKRKPTWKNQ